MISQFPLLLKNCVNQNRNVLFTSINSRHIFAICVTVLCVCVSSGRQTFAKFHSARRRPPVGYDLCIGVPILCLLLITMFKRALSISVLMDSFNKALVGACSVIANLRWQLQCCVCVYAGALLASSPRSRSSAVQSSVGPRSGAGTRQSTEILCIQKYIQNN